MKYAYKIIVFNMILTLGSNMDAKIKIVTDSFESNGKIPKVFTCDDKNKVPNIIISGVPINAKSLVLICDDPDAPTKEPWVHWIIYNIPLKRTNLLDLGRQLKLSDGTMQGLNDFGRIGYDGPCPPTGKDHRYFFRIYALDTILSLEPGVKRSFLDRAMASHIIDQAELIGIYRK